MKKYLEKLEKANLLVEGVRCGVIQPEAARALVIERTYWKYIKTGIGPYQAAARTGIDCRVDWRTVYRVLKRMR